MNLREMTTIVDKVATAQSGLERSQAKAELGAPGQRDRWVQVARHLLVPERQAAHLNATRLLFLGQDLRHQARYPGDASSPR